MSGWYIWQDSPAFGCDDNPSYAWFARRVTDGHVCTIAGPFASEGEAERSTDAADGVERPLHPQKKGP
jgi:hypothetical protein